ncbi:KTSC domain-containing protein [Dyadobacter sediminis]|uniref:KTSC domain-containing protein n=1 Tax=Dyadobacter sediminis TaxID=1493691 RepID=A0A5R9K9U2_9BACT|nr:KTSC domain-containing protein [Dyadobacter sediminis]TLU91601.1 KTSC domain-containing protein [Dyadobacter sediminis]GGC02046.1 hypothetical protein GCM10011325_31410 [Dyadobacter sediminis]
MDMVSVDSSSLAAIGYDYPKRTLRVKFLSGRMYDYKEVDPEIFQLFLKSPSKGSFFDRNIKDCGYPFIRLE